MPGLRQQAVLVQGMLDNLKSFLRSDRQLCVPGCQMHAQATATLLLRVAISCCTKSQTGDQVFVKTFGNSCMPYTSLTIFHARFHISKFSIVCYTLFLKTMYIIF